MKFWEKPLSALPGLWRGKSPPRIQSLNFQSVALERDVKLDIYLPPNYLSNSQHMYPFVLFNDGQDLPRMSARGSGFQDILGDLFFHHKIPPVIAVGIYASGQRMREYGTTRQPDYKGRGDLAGKYSEFVLEELLPFLYRHYRISDQSEDAAIAGFSLGGLAAFDIAWANPPIFGKVGVFSGALWWRWSSINPKDPDADRIMHDIVQKTEQVNDNQCFWFQCGSLDETVDRNKNGVIDAIDDTLDLIKAIQNKGFRAASIRYLEIKGGRHDPETWGKAMPDFLRWAFLRFTADG